MTKQYNSVISEVKQMNEVENTTLSAILDATKSEFLEKGFMSASLRNIVKTAGVTTGAISAELVTGIIVTSLGMILKLGIATVALVGSIHLIYGDIDVLTLFMFLLVASHLYDPMQSALQNLAAVIAMRTNVERMNEILEHPVQQGENTLTNNWFDIVFEHVGFPYNDGETVLKDVSFTAKQGEVTGLSVPPAA